MASCCPYQPSTDSPTLKQKWGVLHASHFEFSWCACAGGCTIDLLPKFSPSPGWGGPHRPAPRGHGELQRRRVL